MNGIVTIGVVNGKAVKVCNKCGKPIDEGTLCKTCAKQQKPHTIDEKLKAFRSGKIGGMGW